jgi:NADH-quinone oxidoreductase subunit G
VAVRDGEVVQVKARQNAEVNKEWLCDEGRYGFMRFLPEKRLSGVVSRAEGGKLLSVDEGAIALTKFADQETAILLAPDLLLEDYRVIKHFAEKVIKKSSMTLAYAERSLTKVESILISPDYAANFRGAEWVGVANGELEARYRATLADIRSGKVKRVLIIGDRAVGAGEIDSALLAGIRAASLSVFIGTDASSPLAEATQFTFGGRSILERSGLLVNRNMRLQYTAAALDPATTTEPVWKILARAAHRSGVKITAANSDRDLTLEFLAGEPRLLGLRIASIVRQRGVCLKSYQPGSVESSSLVEARSLG